jgi:hypothetical protein
MTNDELQMWPNAVAVVYDSRSFFENKRIYGGHRTLLQTELKAFLDSSFFIFH